VQLLLVLLQMTHTVAQTWNDGMYHFLLSISSANESVSFVASGIYYISTYINMTCKQTHNWLSLTIYNFLLLLVE